MTIKTIVDFNEESYKSLCHEMISLIRLEKEIEVKKKELKARIVATARGDRMENGIKVTRVVRKGSIDYKKFLSVLYPDTDIDDIAKEYRKDDISYWEVRSY